MTKPKKKIAILGSGMASLASAYELTTYPDWQENYEITIYQMGWRLGGKTATGRGQNERIQEHGIHIAQGWYENAFRLIRDAYTECKNNNLMPESPFLSWEDAFVRENTTLLTHFDSKKGKWIKKNIIFPQNNYLPGEGGPLPFSAIIKKVIEMIRELLFGKNPALYHGAREHIPIQPLEMHSVWKELCTLVGKINPANRLEHEAERYLLHLAQMIDKSHSANDPVERIHHHSVIQSLIKTLWEWLKKVINAISEWSEDLYWIAVFAEFGIINMKGTFEDVYDPKVHKLNYDNINHLDYREWLKSHEASDRLLNSAMVRFLYVGTFHNLTGKQQQGSLAAGVGLHFLTISIGYKGSFVWKFRAGTADTMITPIYLVLKRRGVKFKFFHKVEQVHYSDTSGIERVSMAEQVKLKTETYNPTYNLKGIQVWPAQPLYDQIEDEQAKKLKDDNVDLEMAWSSWRNYKEFDLVKGVDFDYLLLGIPVDVLGGDAGICRDIIEKHPRWNEMYNNVKTIPTMSMQLWIKPKLNELGMNLQEWGFPEGSRPNLVTYATPQYSWIDMSQVLSFENWKDQEPGLIIYYTGSFPDPAVIPPLQDLTYPGQQIDHVMRVSEQWLHDNMGWFFPNATSIEYPNGMDFKVIFDFSGNSSTDYGLLKTQYFRANVNPTDRYTLSLPGTNKFRMRTNETGFDNMVIAGDWTNFGVNVGYYEGAIISGLQAGQALRKKLNLTSSTPIYSEIPMS